VEEIFKVLATSGKALPPVVFTMHDFEGPGLFALRKSPLVVRFSASRPDPQDATQRAMCARIVTRLCAVANQMGLADAVAQEAMRSFDGDLKQLMLRGECALRTLHGEKNGGPPAAGFAAKDTELVDPFYAVRLVYDTRSKLPADLLADVFDQFTLMPVLLSKNYMAALPRARNLEEEKQLMDGVAACADAWSVLATYDPYWAVKDLQNVGRVYALSAVRHHRHAVGAKSMPRDAQLDCAARRPFHKTPGAHLVDKYRNNTAGFRLSTLECVERLAMDRTNPRSNPFFMQD
jgi:hypothetical protein